MMTRFNKSRAQWSDLSILNQGYKKQEK